MGVLKTLTDEYFGETIRKEDEIDISGLDVEIVSFTDNNGVEHRRGYKVKDGNPDEMAKTLKTLIKRIIEKRGNECSLNDIDVSNIKQMCYEDEESDIIGVFEKSPFNGDISGWDVSNVEDMFYMFYFAESFNQDISGWDVSSVKDMRDMFRYATSFNQDISGWDVSSVKDMRDMFRYATSFNQDISGWDVSSVEDMYGMFFGAKSFNQPLDNWRYKISNVKDIRSMFRGAESFNQPLDNWNVSGVEDMRDMFDDTQLEKNNNLPKWYLDRM